MTAELLDPATWRRVTAHLDEVLDLEGEARSRWLADLETREPEIARVVRELLSLFSAASWATLFPLDLQVF